MPLLKRAGLGRGITHFADVDPNDLNALVAQLLPVLLLQMRSLRIARPSPGGEEVQQDELAAIGGDRLLLAGKVLQTDGFRLGNGL